MKAAGVSADAGAGAGQPLEARVAAFRADPQLMEAASRFVAEVLERAKEEAARRLRERDGAAPQMAEAARAGGGAGAGADEDAGGGAGAGGGRERERERLRLKDRADTLRAVGRSLAEVIRQQSADGMRRLRQVWTRVQHTE